MRDEVVKDLRQAMDDVMQAAQTEREKRLTELFRELLRYTDPKHKGSIYRHVANGTINICPFCHTECFSGEVMTHAPNCLITRIKEEVNREEEEGERTYP